MGQRTPLSEVDAERPRFGSNASTNGTRLDPERAHQLEQERLRWQQDQREAMDEDAERRNRSEALRQQRQAEAQQLVKQRSTAFDADITKSERRTSNAGAGVVAPDELHRVEEERRRWQQAQRDALDEQKERQQRAEQLRQQKVNEAAELVRLGRQESSSAGGAAGGGGAASNRALASKFESIAS